MADTFWRDLIVSAALVAGAQLTLNKAVDDAEKEMPPLYAHGAPSRGIGQRKHLGLEEGTRKDWTLGNPKLHEMTKPHMTEDGLFPIQGIYYKAVSWKGVPEPFNWAKH